MLTFFFLRKNVVIDNVNDGYTARAVVPPTAVIERLANYKNYEE